jgi:hypothetical protein
MTGDQDFWRASGWRLLQRDENGWHVVTDDFLRAYLRRPELAPVDDSCAAERALHAALLAAPRRLVTADELGALADADARDNYGMFLGFRDRLAAAGTLEACYLGLFRQGGALMPPLFIDHMAHAILRGVLDGCDDPMRPRAAELLFRSQKLNRADGAAMAADEEIVEIHRQTGGFGNLGRLIAEADTKMVGIELDVLTEENAAIYWERSDAFDTVIDLGFGRPGLDALCRVLEGWVVHFLGVSVRVQPLQHIRDPHWAWHTGLDAESTAILNTLYEGGDIGEDHLRRLLALFRLDFRDPAAIRSDVAGKPVYMGMATDADGVLRLKPQNLLVNLPLGGDA